MPDFQPANAVELRPMLDALCKDGLTEGLIPEAAVPLLALAVVRRRAAAAGISAESALVEVITAIVDGYTPTRLREFFQARLALAPYQANSERSRYTIAARKATDDKTARWQNVSRNEAPKLFANLAGKLYDADTNARARVPAPGPASRRPHTENAPTSSPARHGELSIFAGISGTGVRRIADAWGERRPERVVVHFEDSLLAHVSDNYSHLLATTTHDDRRDRFRALLALPEPVLAAMWLETFVRVAPQIVNQLATANVALVMHGTYYHLRARAPQCVLSHPALGALVESATQVINFVDDITDCYARLRRGGELYHQHSVPLAAVENLARWRAAETQTLAQVARTLGCPFAVIGTKQPTSVLDALTDHPGRGMYLSHPISSPRRHGLTHPNVVALQDELAALAARLRNTTDLPVFEPTAVDELRFDVDEHNNIRSGTLLPRWQLPRNARDGTPIELLSDADPLDNDELQLAETVFENSSRADGIELDSLYRYLQRQTTERDLQLVAQSNIVITYRPAWSPNGTVADGVRAELEYAVDLAQYFPDAKRIAILIHPDEDEHRRQIAAITHVLKEHQQLFTLHASNSKEISSLVEQFLNDRAVASDSDPHRSPTNIADDLWQRLLRARLITPRTANDLDAGVMRNTEDAFFIAQGRHLHNLGQRVLAAIDADLDASEDEERRCHRCNRPILIPPQLALHQYPHHDHTFWKHLTEQALIAAAPSRPAPKPPTETTVTTPAATGSGPASC